MSQTEPVFEEEGYDIIAWANGEKVILYYEFGSYSGEWLMLTKGADEYKVYKDYYGSCSHCDSLKEFFHHSDPITLTRAREFALNYKSFIEIPFITMRNLIMNRTLRSILPVNIRSYKGDIDYDEFVCDAQIAVKVEEGLDITTLDILGCRNQETKQVALKRYGYENFVRDAGMDVIDTNKEDKLLRKDDIVFAYVKDSSTPRRYLLRVPPDINTIHQAIAWTFNMSPQEYHPLAET